jgi:hypothetical protein
VEIVYLRIGLDALDALNFLKLHGDKFPVFGRLRS